ncbi:hypothetical protein POM88_054812 [Heracleum sosnowskyi]|uniref:Uncharacterized protein n=1 Tax=Heracleum sosnowskyi TaxID=360622 RepID=A0AAD8GMT8_9APIA|nr:hypothetical protein POM88_054812 [Heracleum sosnowskyi]
MHFYRMWNHQSRSSWWKNYKSSSKVFCEWRGRYRSSKERVCFDECKKQRYNVESPNDASNAVIAIGDAYIGLPMSYMSTPKNWRQDHRGNSPKTSRKSLTFILVWTCFPDYLLQKSNLRLKGFIVDDNGTDLPDDEDSRRLHRQPLLPREDDQEDLDTILENMKDVCLSTAIFLNNKRFPKSKRVYTAFIRNYKG